MSFLGKRNVYQCSTCGHLIITVDKASGTTPFMIGCRVPVCTGNMQSWMYSIHPIFGEPTYRWVENDISGSMTPLKLEKIPASEFDLQAGQERRSEYLRKAPETPDDQS